MGEATTTNHSAPDAKNTELIDHKSIESSFEESDLSVLTEKQKQIREKLLSILNGLKQSFPTYGSDFFENKFEREEPNNIEYLENFLDAEDSEDLKSVLNFQNENGMTILHDVADFYYEMTKLLLNAGADPNIPDKDGKTPLQVAIDHRCYGAVSLFFDEKLKRLPDKQKKLHKELHEFLDDINYVSTKQKFDSEYKVDNDKIAALKKFLDYHKKENSEDLKIVLNLPSGEFGLTILHNTQSLFYTDTLNLLSGAGANLSVQDIEGKTPLHIAAQYGYQESAKLLLKEGADPNIQDMDGNTPFRLTVMDESLDIIQFFLENDETDINFVHERTGESPIFDAVESKGNSTNILDLMIKSGKKIDFNISNKNGVTILHRAAFIGQRGMIQLLLEQGANVSAVDSEGNNPLHYIIYNNYKFYGADNKDEGREFDYDNGENIIAMISSFVRCHVKDSVKLAYEKIVECYQETDGEALTRLLYEVYNLELEREVKAKEYVNTKNQNGNTPLFFAIESGNHDVINTLLEKGAEIIVTDEKGAKVVVTDKNGYTPFHYAIKNKDPEILKLLISSIIDSEITQEKIEGALNVSSHMQCFSNLLWYSISKSIKDKILHPILLHHSLGIKDIDEQIEDVIPDIIRQDKESYNSVKGELSRIITSAVKETHARFSVRDKEGNTLLHHAVKWGCGEEILDFLVKRGVNINAKNKHGVAPIHIAAKYGKASQMEFFIRNEADLNVQCGNFTKADTEILENNFITMQDGNMDASSVVSPKNDTSYKGATPTFIAADNLNADAIHMFISEEANSNIPNKIGATPVHVVTARILNKDYEEQKREEIYEMFERLILSSTDDPLRYKKFIEVLDGDKQEKEKLNEILNAVDRNGDGNTECTAPIEKSAPLPDKFFYHEVGSHVKEVPALYLDTAYNKVNGFTCSDYVMDEWDLQGDHEGLRYQEEVTAEEIKSDWAQELKIEESWWGEEGDIPENCGTSAWSNAKQKYPGPVTTSSIDFGYSEYDEYGWGIESNDKIKSAKQKAEPTTDINSKEPSTILSDSSTQEVNVEERSHLGRAKLTKHEELKLNKFLDLVSKAQNMVELNKIVDQALKAGIRINYAQGGKCSFTNCVTEKIGKLEGVKESVKIVSNIICQLTSKGVVFGKNYDKINDELKKSGIFEDHEINLQKATKEFSKHINELQRIVESAVVQGELKNLETDNTTFFIECSPDSIVDVAKVINGAKSLVESGGGIVKIGQNTLKIEENNGITNYSNLLGNGRVVLTLEGLEITLYCDTQNKDRMIVEVNDNDMEMINGLSDEAKKEMFGKYLLEGIPLCNAIKQGYCEKSGQLPFSETINLPKKVKEEASELVISLEDSGCNIDTPTNWRNKIRTESGERAAVVRG